LVVVLLLLLPRVVLVVLVLAVLELGLGLLTATPKRRAEAVRPQRARWAAMGGGAQRPAAACGRRACPLQQWLSVAASRSPFSAWLPGEEEQLRHWHHQQAQGQH
jgi:hypothetical protein